MMSSNYKKNLTAIGMLVGFAIPQLVISSDNEVHAGISVNPIGSITSVGYERLLTPGVSVGGRLSSIGYDYWDGGYNEWGNGSGVELTANYHLNNSGFSGPYIGAAIGQATVDWSWYQSPSRGYGTSKLTTFLAAFGWDFNVGNFIIRPSISLGSFSGASKDNTGTKTSKIGAVAGAGVAAVLTF